MIKILLINNKIMKIMAFLINKERNTDKINNVINLFKQKFFDKQT